MYQSEATTAAFNYGPLTEMSSRQDLNTTVQMQKKIKDAGTSRPNLDTVTSSPDLRWLLESSLVSETESAWDSLASFLPSTVPSCPCLCQPSNPDLLHSGIGGRCDDRDKGHVKQKSVEECERRRARRERNRIAAARCRDRRRILTDTLQNETERLERVKSQLEEEIAGLERERERLQLVLEAHRPVCKMDGSNQG